MYFKHKNNPLVSRLPEDVKTLIQENDDPIPMGLLHVARHSSGDSSVAGSVVHPALRGLGLGKYLYGTAIHGERAAGRKRFTSDARPAFDEDGSLLGGRSDAAARVWKKLEKSHGAVGDDSFHAIDLKKKASLNQTFPVKNLGDAVAKINKVYEVAQKQNHHPEVYLDWKKLRLRYYTEEKSKVTKRDKNLAKMIKRSLSQVRAT
jgi:4a-hydroxytetrahydrobiopterin dehydratase